MYFIIIIYLFTFSKFRKILFLRAAWVMFIAPVPSLCTILWQTEVLQLSDNLYSANSIQCSNALHNKMTAIINTTIKIK